MLEAWQWVGDGALEGRAGRGLGEPSWDTGLRRWGPYQGPPFLTCQSSIYTPLPPAPCPSNLPQYCFFLSPSPLLLSWDLG